MPPALVPVAFTTLTRIGSRLPAGTDWKVTACPPAMLTATSPGWPT